MPSSEVENVADYCVYKHTTPSGKVYIGITSKQPETRWNKGLGYRHNLHFVNAIKRYGWDNIKHEVLATGLEPEEAFAEERRLIAELKANDPKYGYNLSEGGESGYTGVSPSAETRKKNGDAHRGRKASEETRKKMSETHRAHPNSGRYQKGRVVSREEVEKSAAAHRGKKRPAEFCEKLRQANLGKKASVEARANMSRAHTGKAGVLCVETGKVYEAVTLAAEATGLPAAIIGGMWSNGPHQGDLGRHRRRHHGTVEVPGWRQ